MYLLYKTNRFHFLVVFSVIRDLKQARTATAVNKQLNFTVNFTTNFYRSYHVATCPITGQTRAKWNLFVKGELKSEISLLHMKVLTLIKAKSNVFLWYVQCCSCTRRSKTKILTTRAPPSWIEFDVVTSQRQTQSASDCVMLTDLKNRTGSSNSLFRMSRFWSQLAAILEKLPETRCL